MADETSALVLLRPLTKQIARAFGVPIFIIEDAFGEEPQASTLAAFCRADGPSRLMVYQQQSKPAGATGDAEPDDEDEDDELGVYVSAGGGELDRFVKGTGVLLVKAREDLELTTAAAVELEVTCTVVLGSPVKALLASVEHIFQPVLFHLGSAWTSKLTEEHTEDFFGSIQKYVRQLSEAVHGVESSIELEKPPDGIQHIELSAKGFARGAGSPELVAGCESTVRSWCETVEALVNTQPQPAFMVPEGDEGPTSELEYWKTRLGRFTAVVEQLKAPGSRAVVGVLSQGRSASMRRWNKLEEPMTIALNEAKDNIKYLATLEKIVEPLYSGTPSQVIEVLISAHALDGAPDEPLMSS